MKLCLQSTEKESLCTYNSLSTKTVLPALGQNEDLLNNQMREFLLIPGKCEGGASDGRILITIIWSEL